MDKCPYVKTVTHGQTRIEFQPGRTKETAGGRGQEMTKLKSICTSNRCQLRSLWFVSPGSNARSRLPLVLITSRYLACNGCLRRTLIEGLFKQSGSDRRLLLSSPAVGTGRKV